MRAAETQKGRFSYTQSTENGFLRSGRRHQRLRSTRLHQRIVRSSSHLKLFSKRYVVMMAKVCRCENTNEIGLNHYIKYSFAYACSCQLRLAATSRFSRGNAFLHTTQAQLLPTRRKRQSTQAKKVPATFSQIKVDREFASAYRTLAPQTKRSICRFYGKRF